MQPATNPAARTPTTPLTLHALPLDLPLREPRWSNGTFGAPSASRSSARNASHGLPRWKVLQLEAYVQAHLGGSLGVDQLARQAGLSTSYFCRAFKRSVGLSPHAYVMRQRFEYACRLMLGSAQSLSDIALACGLFDQAHLCNLFQRMVGQSPSRWRRQHASAAGNGATH